MEKFDFQLIAPGFYSIEQGFVRSFMFMDTHKILLIDTGLGGNQLKAQVREISDLPIQVLYTHADMDHIGDAGDFEHRYMHPSEYDYYESKVKNPVKMRALWQGDVFTIGKYRLEVILIPGHTPGSIALIDYKQRFMIGGDSIQSGPIFMFGPGRNFQAYKDSLIKLKAYCADMDWIYAGHHALKVPSSIIEQLLLATDKMLAGQVLGAFEPRFENKVKRYQTDGIAFFAD